MSGLVEAPHHLRHAHRLLTDAECYLDLVADLLPATVEGTTAGDLRDDLLNLRERLEGLFGRVSLALPEIPTPSAPALDLEDRERASCEPCHWPTARSCVGCSRVTR